MSFKQGSLYRIAEKDFPYFRGSTAFYFSDSESENFIENTIALVVEPLFLLRTKIRSVAGQEMKKYGYWCVKVMINNRVGYIYMWEDEWEEIP